MLKRLMSLGAVMALGASVAGVAMAQGMDMPMNMSGDMSGSMHSQHAMPASASAGGSASGQAHSPAEAQSQREALEQVLAQSRQWPRAMHDNGVASMLMLDRLERVHSDNGTYTYAEGQAWIGTDINKLWLKAEGARVDGKTEDANAELYYSRAVAAFWDFQVGLRHDFSADGGPSRNWLGVGFQGLAPYMFETDVTVYAGSQGRSAARLRGEYDFYLTQRLVFWPEAEFNLYGKADPERALGSGLASSNLTLRLRYEIRREIAPYFGVQWVRKYGGTADYARAEGAPVSDTQYMAGIRLWW